MDFFFNMPLITPALGWFMRLCYMLVGNVGVAIILFTVVVRVAMFPVSVKQEKAQIKTQIFMPKIREIQQRHRGDNAKMQAELSKLTSEGYNPGAGCLPMILTMLILFGVLGVVYKPMTYFERIDSEQIEVIREMAVEIEFNKEFESQIDQFLDDRYNSRIESFIESEENEYEVYEDIPLTERNEIRQGVSDSIRDGIDRNRISAPFDRIQHELEIMRVFRENPAAFAQIDPDVYATLMIIQDRIVLFGIDFSEIPTPTFPMIMVPILSFFFAALQMIIMQQTRKKSAPDALKQMGMMRYFLYFLPVMSLFIAFQFPAGAGFYWTISAIMGCIQSLVIYKMWPPEKIRAEVLAALDAKGIKHDNVIVIEKSNGNKVEKKLSEMSGKEEKEYYRKRLEEARKADLEKYGVVPDSPNHDSSEIEVEAEFSEVEIEAEFSDDSADTADTKEDPLAKNSVICKHCGTTNDKGRNKCRSCDKRI
jgi:YidC/Oxa1 family membrane protein insertase